MDRRSTKCLSFSFSWPDEAGKYESRKKGESQCRNRGPVEFLFIRMLRLVNSIDADIC